LALSEATHTSHALWQALLQQTPLAQKPEAHCDALAHGCPLATPHAPSGPQTSAPVQLSGSGAPLTI
jgi:hypothetical protein